MKLVLFLDRDLDLSCEVIVSEGATIKDAKSLLALKDQTGATKVEDIDLRLPLKPGRLPLPLPDGMVISEKYAELDVIERVGEDTPTTVEEDQSNELGNYEDEAPEGSAQKAQSQAAADEEPPFPPMAPADIDYLTDVAQEKQSDLKQQASDAVGEGNLGQALQLMTEAICIGCASALMYSKRAEVLLQLRRPRAAVNDCSAALNANPDAAKAFKVRGRAFVMLEEWVAAQADFQEVLKLDYDHDTYLECAAIANKLKGEVDSKKEEGRESGPQLWEILGCSGQVGISVREDMGVLSVAKVERLAVGSIVEETLLSGSELFYSKLSGDGPDEGWISIVEYDKPVAIRVYPNGEPPFPKFAPTHVRELSEEDLEQQNLCKQRSADNLEDGDLAAALSSINEAIEIGCPSSLMYSRRAHILLQLARPRAAINDCDEAIRINPESGKAFKTRARAHAKLEEWSEAHRDFQVGLKFECDDEAGFEECQKIAATLKSIQSSAVRSSCQLWEIVGGAGTGGLLVREQAEISSHPKSTRLGCGAVVGEVELRGDRLNYSKISGIGPQEGWISIALNAKVLAVRVSSAEVDDEEDETEEDPFPPMAPLDVKSLSEDVQDKVNVLKQEASDASDVGDERAALEKLTEAICLGCPTALMYSRRARLLLSLGRPQAAMNDCDAALAINPDSAKALGIRARANSKLKRWLAAHADFQESLKIDFDDEVYQESLKVSEKAKNIQGATTEQRLKIEDADRRKRIFEYRQEQQSIAAQEAAQRARDEQVKQDNAARVCADPTLYPILVHAKRQGWMADFSGQKRGPCSCNKCVIYCWRPTRLSSCAAANVSVTCVVCGCPPNKHPSLGFATMEDLQ